MLISILLLASPASAWGPVGHKTVALIAQRRLSPAARAKVRELLGPDVGLDDIAVCADVIREAEVVCGGIFSVKADPASAPWHFIDIPVSDSPSAADLGKYCVKNGRSDDCVVAQIRSDLKILADLKASVADKRLALMFAVHFVGDAHQPLHCATKVGPGGRSDRGGNLEQVRVAGARAGEEVNLHALWDGLLFSVPGDRRPPPKALAKKLEARLKDKDVSAWTAGDPVSAAALESFAFAKERIYPAYLKSSAVDEDYEARMRPEAYERLERGGVRLAFLLNEALR